MAEDLLETIGQVFGPVRGGLALAVIFVGALLAATTGVVAAAVISMGLISLPIMLRYGYNRTIATGVITASGTLAQAIPPSLVLIVMADQLGRSVGDMYAGAPGAGPAAGRPAMPPSSSLSPSSSRPGCRPCRPRRASTRKPTGPPATLAAGADAGRGRGGRRLVAGARRHHRRLDRPRRRGARRRNPDPVDDRFPPSSRWPWR
jgi:hypothetical protein